jgi:hypothetical protein
MKKSVLIAGVLFGISSLSQAQEFFVHENWVGNLQNENGKFVAWKGSPNNGIGYISASGDPDNNPYDPRKNLVSPR